MVLANVSQQLHLAGRDDLPIKIDRYNELLAAAIPTWSTSESPIAPAMLREHYSCNDTSCVAAYDGLHPNVLGEYQIAQAFSEALGRLISIGKSAIVIPDEKNLPVRPCLEPSNFTVATSPGHHCGANSRHVLLCIRVIVLLRVSEDLVSIPVYSFVRVAYPPCILNYTLYLLLSIFPVRQKSGMRVYVSP
jgi:hypothetical protein